jgi:1-deoxy-D-xylulose-5-phosphate reductoisomerase
MKRIVILGSTGSIGESALRVVRALPRQLRVVGLSANRNHARLLEQAAEFDVSRIALADSASARACCPPQGVALQSGDAALEELAALPEADLVLCSLVGISGLRPVLAAARAGKTIALATKEVLVVAGAIVLDACREYGATLLPVDSEHSAIHQCLTARGPDPHSIRRILLTASGGPFSGQPDIDLATVTPELALDHPRWAMGPKVTVDSATLMNKGLEIMEARWLFDVPVDAIDVALHPESIVHSMVEFRDGSIMAQISPPDMRFAIQYALTYPNRLDGGLPAWDPTAGAALSFGSVDEERFPCLRLAKLAACRGGTLPAVLNAANEVAVDRFLGRALDFPGIGKLVRRVMDDHTIQDMADLDAILEADKWARETAIRVASEMTP